jgi:hypothetical protein
MQAIDTSRVEKHPLALKHKCLTGKLLRLSELPISGTERVNSAMQNHAKLF